MIDMQIHETNDAIENAALREALIEADAVLAKLDAEMRARLGSSYGETRDQVCRTLAKVQRALAPAHPPRQDGLCEGCPPVGYPTDKTRCLPCPRHGARQGEWKADWEAIAFNLCSEFGSDFVEDKHEFAKAVVREYLRSLRARSRRDAGGGAGEPTITAGRVMPCTHCDGKGERIHGSECPVCHGRGYL